MDTRSRLVYGALHSPAVLMDHGPVAWQAMDDRSLERLLIDYVSDDILAFTAFTAFPEDVWTQICSDNPAERLNKEIRRRTYAVPTAPEIGTDQLLALTA